MSKVEINVDKVVKEIRKRLKPSGWDDKLCRYLMSYDFKYIIESLADDKKYNGHFVPAIKDMFTWLYECPVNEIKVAMLIDVDIKNNFSANVGIPMSNENGMPNELHKKIHKSLPGTESVGGAKGNYKHWCNQGVLMIPLACTVRLYGTPHYKIWKPFIGYLVETINIDYPEVPWISIGRKATQMTSSVVTTENKYSVDFYPEFNVNNCWENVNNILKKQSKPEIKW
jgi:uracil DNA glycosylase